MAFLVCVTIIFAQTRQSENVSLNAADVNGVSVNLLTDKAVGDTLMYFDGYYIWVVDPADQALFAVESEELTGFALNATPVGWGMTPEWMIFYDLDVNLDTVYMWASCSWFEPPGQANNWIYFGPVTIPVTGGKLKWEHKMPDDSYSDGYKVYLSTTGMTYFDFVGSTPVFTRPDNPANAALDTVFVDKVIDIPAAYAGQQTYFAFQHDANDMFILYLTRWLVTEAQNVGVENLNTTCFVSQNYPNPVQSTSIFSYSLPNNSNVNIEIFDITGRLLVSENAQRNAGTHSYTIDAENLPNGTYYYTLTAGEYKTTRKFVVVK